MKLLYVVENYPPHMGGVELVFKNTCEGMARSGNSVTVVTHKIKGSPSRETMNGVNIIRVPCFGNRYLFTFLAPFWALRPAFKADIVHTTTYNGAPPAWLVAKLARKPVVITVHETWVGHWKRYTNMSTWKAALHEILERPIWWLRFDKYITISESTKRQLIGVIPKNIHNRIIVNHVGFDSAPWERKKHVKKARAIKKQLDLEKKFVVLGYGRPGFSKGFEYLVKAFPAIRKKIKNAHLVLILSHDKAYEKEYAHIKELLKTLKIDKHTTLLDPVKYTELPIHVVMADCVVIPSLCEGFGYTTVESNAAGTPVVASNVASIPEVISGKHVLVKPRSAKGIAEGVQLVAKKKYNNTKRKKFLWKDNKKRLEKIYKLLDVK